MFPSRTTPDDDHGVERAVMAEHRVRREHRGRPDEQPERRRCSAGTAASPTRLRIARSIQAWTTESAVATYRSWTRAPRRVQHEPGQDRHDERREDRADQVGQPAAPADLRADEPDEHAAERGVRRACRGTRSRPRTQRASSIGQGEDDAHDEDRAPSVTQPSAGASGIAARRSSGEDLPERPARGDRVRPQLVLGERVAQGPHPLGRQLVGLGVAARRSRRSTRPARRRRASRRPAHPGSRPRTRRRACGARRAAGPRPGRARR